MKHIDQGFEATDARPFDVGIVVALREEFAVLLEDIEYESREYAAENMVFYFFWVDQNPQIPNSGYHCVATFIGEMGPTSAAVATERMLSLFSPITIVNLGICGTMSNDVKVGDVVIGDIIDEYISAAKASNALHKEAFPLKLSGKPYTTTRDYLLKCEHLQFTKDESFKAWQLSCEKMFDELAEKHRGMLNLINTGVLNKSPTFHKGHVASGPIVSGAVSYKNFLLAFRDRKYVAVEMEAAGVMAAAADRTTRTLVLRGVSDPSDERKPPDEKYGCEGALRQLAMKNATKFLWMIMKLGLLYFGNDVTVSSEKLAKAQEEESADKKALSEPNYVINFNYLPDSIQLHGWRIGLKNPSTPAPRITAIHDSVFNTALSVEGPFSARLDYSVSEDYSNVRCIDVLLIEFGQFSFYTRIEVTKDVTTRPVWLNIRPGADQPSQYNAGEWNFEVASTSALGKWTVLKVDLEQATKETFGTDGWQFNKLLGFRIRGTVQIARIGLYLEK